MEANVGAVPVVAGGLEKPAGEVPARVRSVRARLDRSLVGDATFLASSSAAGAAIYAALGGTLPQATTLNLGLAAVAGAGAAIVTLIRGWSRFADRLADAAALPRDVAVAEPETRDPWWERTLVAALAVPLLGAALAAGQAFVAWGDRKEVLLAVVCGFLGRDVGLTALGHMVEREERELGVTFLEAAPDEADEDTDEDDEAEADDRHDPGPLFYVPRS